MLAFITGASGHVGANLVRALLAGGHQVRALVRSRSNNAALDGVDVERIEGDLLAPERFADPLHGCDALFHLAAMVSLREIDRDRLHTVNVHGTSRLLATALRVGVRKVVHCSSFETIERNVDDTGSRGARPATSASRFERSNPYGDSKRLAEAEALRFAAKGLDVTIVNPTAVVGPWDFKPSMLGRTILDICRSRLHGYVPGTYDFVAAQDVARGHLLACDNGRRGERYVLSGESVTLAQMIDWVVEAGGGTKPPIAIPPDIALRFAAIKDWVECRWRPHHHPRFNRHSIALLQADKAADKSKAERELGWTPGPVREAVFEHVRWLVDRT